MLGRGHPWAVAVAALLTLGVEVPGVAPLAVCGWGKPCLGVLPVLLLACSAALQQVGVQRERVMQHSVLQPVPCCRVHAQTHTVWLHGGSFGNKASTQAGKHKKGGESWCVIPNRQRPPPGLLL